MKKPTTQQIINFVKKLEEYESYLESCSNEEFHLEINKADRVLRRVLGGILKNIPPRNY